MDDSDALEKFGEDDDEELDRWDLDEDL